MQKHPIFIITLGFCVVLLQREKTNVRKQVQWKIITAPKADS